MARKFATNIDATGNQILNVVAQHIAGAPGSPIEGQFFYNTSTHKWGYYNGTAEVYPTEAAGVSEASSSTLGTIKTTGDLGGSGGAPTVVHFTLTSNASAGTHKITEVAEPTEAKDAANKEYVDNKANGIAWKKPVTVATAGALPANTAAGTEATHTLTANSNEILEVDGVKLETKGQRVLVKNQATEKNNGIYELTTVGTAGVKWVLTRTADGATEPELLQATMRVEEGTANKETAWNNSTKSGFTVDTTALTFVEIESATQIKADKKYIERTGNTLELKPDETTPAEPAENEVKVEGEGGTRKKTFRLRGNASATEFTVTHNLNTEALMVQGQENNSGKPGKPIEFDWEPTSVNAIKIIFPEAPGKSTNYFGAIFG
jgi:hypothetical protein